jgi:hypothetical protein
VAAAEDLFVEVGARFLEVVETVGHGSSGMGFCHRDTEGTERIGMRLVTVGPHTPLFFAKEAASC